VSRPEHEYRPAVGVPGGPAFGERTGAKVDLHIGVFKDGRWSYLYGKDTEYGSAVPDIEAVREAARRARTGELGEHVQGPVMKPPVWTWEVPLYFWFGGIAAGSSFVALACDLAGDERSAATARKVALAALGPCPVLLVLDLGRPERFYNMLRIFKPRSPMSMGAWALTAFGNLAAAAVGADLLGRRRAARALGGANALVGGYLGSYTGVLLASTAVPVWSRSRLFLGPIFVSTATATGAAAVRLALVATGLPHGHPTREALGRVETGAMTAELVLSTVNERRLGRLAHAVEDGTPGRFLRAAKWLVRGGLALRLARRRGGPVAHHVASVAYLAAGLCFRFAWVLAGPPSARDDEAVARTARAHAIADEPDAVLRVVHTR
jgi:formate-dependent nitrite reductase membrane component NrfD